MSELAPATVPTFVVWEDAFTPAELGMLTAFGDGLTADSATVKSADPDGAVRQDIRITRTSWMPPSPDSQWIYDRIQRVARSLNDRAYQFDLRGFSENFQYTIYNGTEGGHYDWHVDQGPLKVQRKLSISVQLSAPSDYEGCNLEFQAGNKIETAPRTHGAVIAFPSYVLHRVTPCTKGTRKALVCWTTGPEAAMSAPIGIGGYKVAVWKDAFTPAEIDRIVAHGDSLEPMRAQLEYGRDAAQQHRITRVAWIERNSQTEWLFARLEEISLRLNSEIFKYELFGLSESLQYTVYEGSEGGHYNWHVDIGAHNPEPRKISLSLQLSDPSDYEGGRLVIEAGDGAYPAETARGTIIAFPSYVLHRVTPTELGVRKSLVIWVGGPEFR